MPSNLQPPVTIYQTLKPHALSDKAFARFKPLQDLIVRVLGEPPNCDNLNAISPTTFYIDLVLTGPSFTMPQSDLGISPMTIALRVASFFTASYNFDCAYCAAHACVAGDVFKGSIDQQVRRGAPLPLFTTDVNHPDLSAAERASMKLAKAASARKNLPPTAELRKLVQSLRDEAGDEAVEGVKACICMAGFLNACMDTLGVELESGANHFARFVLGKAGIRFEEGIHKSTREYNEPRPQTGIVGILANIASLLGVLPSLVRVKLMEREALEGLPQSGAALEQWAQQNLGYVPACVRNIQRVDLKRAACFGIRHIMLSDGEEKYHGRKMWSLDERCAFLYTYGREVGCDELMDLATKLAKVHRRELEGLANGSGEERWSEGVQAAREVIKRQLAAPENVVDDVVERVTSVCQPQAVIELVGMIAWFCYYYRMVTLFGDED